MPEPIDDHQLEETVQIVRRLVSLQPRFKVIVPEDLARAKTHLDKLRSGSKSKSPIDRHLVYSMVAIFVRQAKPLTMGELSQALDVPLSTATRIVDWLVKSGYAERLPDPQDRRVVRVALTKSGRALIKAWDKFVRQRVEQVLCVFTAEERRTLIALLNKLVETLENQEAQ